MKDYRHISPEFTNIANALIQAEPELQHIRNSNVRIGILTSEISKKKGAKIVHGICEKVADKYKWSIPFDFLITIFESTITGFNPEQIKILIFHELLHVGIDGEDKYHVIPHDLEDFKLIIEKYGTTWSE